MKKKSMNAYLRGRKLKKLLLTMKLTVLLLLFGLMQVSATVYSQATKFDFQAKNKQIVEVLNEIEGNSNFRFFYISEQVDVNRRVDINGENRSVEDILNEMFKGKGVKYEIGDDFLIILSPEKTSGKTSVSPVEQKSVSGRITDGNGEPLPGVAIIIKGTTQGTVTDVEGNFSITNVDSNTILQFSFVGMKTQEILVSKQTVINVTMDEDAIGLEEVVAVGYGIQKKSVVTGAISSVNSDNLVQSRPTNISQALNGRAAGVITTQGSAQPGSIPKITIRGVGTNGNSDPLIIVDGLPMSDMNNINPNDVENMEILKDATSAAIYGARAANGVILITTKKGKTGKSKVEYNGFYGIQSAYNIPDLLGTDDYIMLMKEFYANDGLAYPSKMPSENKGIDTNWIDAITYKAPVQEHNITARMGSDKGSTLISLGYRNQDGIIGGNLDKSFYKRYTARINSVVDITDFVKIGANVSYIHKENRSIPTPIEGGWDPINKAFYMDPTTPVYDSDNGDNKGYGVSSVPYTGMFNPLAFFEVASNGFNKTGSLYGNSYLEINILNGLSFKSDIGVELDNSNSRGYQPIYEHSNTQFSDENTVTQKSYNSSFWQWENTLNYSRDINDHSFAILLGTSASHYYSESLQGERKNLPSEAQVNSNFWYLNSGDVSSSLNSGDASVASSLASIFCRLSYNYQEKYMAELVLRRDGSSNFGPKNKYAIFPALSAGWNIAREEFWSLDNITQMKIRASWGQNGNERINPFSYTSIIGNDGKYVLGTDGHVVTASAPLSLVNEDVKWETSEQLNVGVDVGFFNNKLRANIDYFDKKTKDLLFLKNIEDVRGNEPPFYNVGKVSNKGIEIQLSYDFNLGTVNFRLDANASYLKNKVLAVGSENGYVDGGEWAGINVTRMEEGFPIGYFYGYKIDGIFQNEGEVQRFKDNEGNLTYPDAGPGDFKWKDINKDGQITTEDRQMIGNPWPKWVYGINIAADWKNFDLGVFMNGKADVDVWTMAKYAMEAHGRANLPTFFLDRWTKPGDNNGVARLTINDPNQNRKKPSEFWVKDASYFKIGTIELGYSLPNRLTQRVNIEKLRFFVGIDNVAIFTKYPMFDPEVGSMNGDIFNTGIDKGVYPQARTIRLGLILSL